MDWLDRLWAAGHSVRATAAGENMAKVQQKASKTSVKRAPKNTPQSPEARRKAARRRELRKVTGVECRVEKRVIPTYGIGESPTTPIFYEGRANQGAQGHVYPYPLQDTLNDVRTDREWTCIVLENEHLYFEILPELGGRLYRAVDKHTGYDFFYRQEVIKPALIGVLGAWMSGGVEWNFPHHHRTTTFMPVEWSICEDEDRDDDLSGWTVTIRETDRRSLLTSEVELHLDPDASFLEVGLQFFNASALPQSFLYWSNAAVHANEQYQVIFPPDAYYAIHHAKDAACSWPVFTGDYKGIHFDHTDLSWWKNHPAPASFFCGRSDLDFFGGYDHGQDAGTVIWADHHVANGKKFFLWGNNERARVWDQTLTDDNGPYLELMAGVFSDNQPDYTWLQPGELKEATQYFYPVRGLHGGIKAASTLAALNVVYPQPDGEAICYFNVNVPFKSVKIVCERTDGSKEETSVCLKKLKPGKAYSCTLPIRQSDDVRLTIWELDAEDDCIQVLQYHQCVYPERPMPTLTVPPDKPETFPTVEQLYYAGQRLEQFHNPILACEPYYEEALRRDPGDYRTNLAVGVRLAKRGLWQDAERHFRTALERAEFNNTTPQDGTVYYLLGTALRCLGRKREAIDCLSKACWYPGWKMVAEFGLNKLAPVKFRQYYYGMPELHDEMLPDRRLRRLLERHGDLNWSLMPHLADFLEREEWDEMIELVQMSQTHYPLALYYVAYAYGKQGRERYIVLKKLAQASEASPDYCFPCLWQTEAVLRFALEMNPSDCQALYYLGCLLRYFERHDEALACWEAAAKAGSKVGDLYYCLGHAYEKADRLDEAVAMYLKAMEVAPDNPIFVREYDKLAEKRQTPAAERLAFLEGRQQVVAKRDDVLLREIVLLNRLERFDDALASLASRRFYVWEGNEVIVHDAYVAAHLGRGRRRLDAGEAAPAREDFEAALEYPVKLGVGRPYREIRGRMTQYWLAKAIQAEGKADEARAMLETCVSDLVSPADAAARLCQAEVPFYQALALRELGRADEATTTLRTLRDFCRKTLGGADEQPDFFAKFSESQADDTKQAVFGRLLQKVNRELGDD